MIVWLSRAPAPLASLSSRSFSPSVHTLRHPLLAMLSSLRRAATCLHSSRQTHFSTLGSFNSQPFLPSQVYAQIFLDFNWLEKHVYACAEQKFGRQAPENSWALDAGPLQRFMEDRLTQAIEATTPSWKSVGNHGVKVQAAYAYGSSTERARRTIVRALSEEQVSVRSFPSSQNTPICAPAVALAADLVHACSIRGPVDWGMPIHQLAASAAAGEGGLGAGAPSSSTAKQLPITHAVIAAHGSPTYFPAMARASQHDRLVVLASTHSEWARLSSQMIAEQRETTLPLFLDDLLPRMVLTPDEFRANAASKELIAAKLCLQLLHRQSERAGQASTSSSSSSSFSSSAGTTIWANELVPLLRDLQHLKDLRKHGLTLKDFLREFPQLFELQEQEGAGGGGGGSGSSYGGSGGSTSWRLRLAKGADAQAVELLKKSAPAATGAGAAGAGVAAEMGPSTAPSKANITKGAAVAGPAVLAAPSSASVERSDKEAVSRAVSSAVQAVAGGSAAKQQAAAQQQQQQQQPSASSQQGSASTAASSQQPPLLLVELASAANWLKQKRFSYFEDGRVTALLQSAVAAGVPDAEASLASDEGVGLLRQLFQQAGFSLPPLQNGRFGSNEYKRAAALHLEKLQGAIKALGTVAAATPVAAVIPAAAPVAGAAVASSGAAAETETVTVKPAEKASGAAVKGRKKSVAAATAASSAASGKGDKTVEAPAAGAAAAVPPASESPLLDRTALSKLFARAASKPAGDAEVAEEDSRLQAVLEAAAAAGVVKGSQFKKSSLMAAWTAAGFPDPLNKKVYTTREWKEVVAEHAGEVVAALKAGKGAPVAAGEVAVQ